MVINKQFLEFACKRLFKDSRAISNGFNAAALQDEKLIVESLFNVVVMEHDSLSARSSAFDRQAINTNASWRCTGHKPTSGTSGCHSSTNTGHRNVNYLFPRIRWSSVLRRFLACVPFVPAQTLGFVSRRRFSETASSEQIFIGISDSLSS